MKSLLYRIEAGLDVEEAYDWYEQQRKGLGTDFLAEIRVAEEAIRAMPLSHRIYRRDRRRFLVHRFPYQLLYRVLDDAIVIVACFHLRTIAAVIEIAQVIWMRSAKRAAAAHPTA